MRLAGAALCLAVASSVELGLHKRPYISAATRLSRSTTPRMPLFAARKAPIPAEENGNFQVLVTSLIKNIVGAGLFSLPAGVAAGAGLGPGIALTVAMGVISGWTFFVLGWASAATDSTTYAELWSRTVGPKSVRIIDIAVIVMAFGACVQFTSTIVQLLAQLSPAAASFSWAARVVFTSACMLPLVIATNLSALNLSSIIGVIGVAYSALFCIYRLAAGTYRASSPAASLALLKPRRAIAILPLVGSLNTAFTAHLNVPRYWSELQSQDINQFASLARLGFGFSTIACLLFLICGYLTFGDSCRGLLLDMYAINDMGARAMRFMTLLSVAGGYPLIFMAMRDSCVALFRLSVTDQIKLANKRTEEATKVQDRLHSPGRRFEVVLSILLLLAVTGVSLFATDVRFIIAIRGALLGSIVTLVLPSLVLLNSSVVSKGSIIRLCSKILVAYGALSSVVGTIACFLER